MTELEKIATQLETLEAVQRLIQGAASWCDPFCYGSQRMRKFFLHEIDIRMTLLRFDLRKIKKATEQAQVSDQQYGEGKL